MMTREEAIAILQEKYDYCKSFYDLAARPKEDYAETAQYLQALQVALSALRPVSREHVEKVWRGEWQDTREAYNDVPKRRCSRCKSVFIGLDTPFCEVCGAPMTDEAVEMVMERINKMEETGDGLG